jgi:hypothetical protein
MVTVPPLTDVAIDAPVESAETPFVSCTVVDVSSVEFAKVRTIEATILLGIAAKLRPHIKHVAVPGPYLQESALSVSAASSVTVADMKSAVE